MKGVFRYLNNAVNADDYDAKIAHDDLPKNKRVNFIRCITLLYLTKIHAKIKIPAGISNKRYNEVSWVTLAGVGKESGVDVSLKR